MFPVTATFCNVRSSESPNSIGFVATSPVTFIVKVPSFSMFFMGINILNFSLPLNSVFGVFSKSVIFISSIKSPNTSIL